MQRLMKVISDENTKKNQPINLKIVIYLEDETSNKKGENNN